MVNESFNNIFDASLIDYSNDFQEQDQLEYDKQRALDWVFTNCVDVTGEPIDPKNIRYNSDKTIDILRNGLCMRGHNIGKYGKSWTYTSKFNQGETITEIPEYVNFKICWGSCDLSHNKLKSLRGCPRLIMKDTMNSYMSSSYGDFYVDGNKLENLEYFPEYICGDFRCTANPLKSFDGINLNWVSTMTEEGHNITYPNNLVSDWLDLVRENKEKLKKFAYANEVFKKYGINKVNESFEDAFDSSLIDYSSDFEKQDKISQIKNWMEKSTITHCDYVWVPLVYNVDYKINDDYTIDTFCDITIQRPDRWYEVIYDLKDDYPTEFPNYINFNISHDSFAFKENSGITSLRGCPKEVNGSFYCWGNNLKTLEGGPEKVSGNYNASGNKLISLKGSPKIIGTPQRNAFFNLYDNKLESLEYGPEIIYGNFTVEKNKLRTLKNSPVVTGEFNIRFNNNIPKDEFWELMNSGKIESWDLTPKQCEIFGWNTKMFNKNKVNEDFSDAFDSSLLDYSGDLEQSDENYKNTVKKDIAEWCAKHVFVKILSYSDKYGTFGSYSGIPAKITVNDDYSIDVHDDIYFDHMMSEDSNEIELPDNIKFNVIHGSVISEGDNWISLKGFPERVEGLLQLSYIESLKTYEGFPKEVHSLEISSCPLNDLKKHLPELCQNPAVDPDKSYISCKLFYSNDRISASTAKVKDRSLYNELIKKYKKYFRLIDYIETDRCDTAINGWVVRKINESFEDAFDSSLIDYSTDFKESDEKQVIENWIKTHVVDKSTPIDLFVVQRDENEVNAYANTKFNYDYEIIKGSNNTWEINITGNAIIVLDKDLHEIPYKFNKIKGDFIIAYPGPQYATEYNMPYQLWSLKNMPNEVHGDFSISGSKLDNLVGSPFMVAGDFIAIGCGLTSIKGITEHISGDLLLNHNDIQDSAEDFVKYIGPNTGQWGGQKIYLTSNKTNLWNLKYNEMIKYDFHLDKPTK